MIMAIFLFESGNLSAKDAEDNWLGGFDYQSHFVITA